MASNKICATCKWRYETEHYIGCGNPSPNRNKWAEYHHVWEPCGIWEESIEVTTGKENHESR